MRNDPAITTSEDYREDGMTGETNNKTRRFKPGLHKRVVKGVKTPRASRSKYADLIKGVKVTKPGTARRIDFPIKVAPGVTPLQDRLHSARCVVERSQWLSEENKATLLRVIREHTLKLPQWEGGEIEAYTRLPTGREYMSDDEYHELRKSLWRPGDDGHMPHR